MARDASTEERLEQRQLTSDTINEIDLNGTDEPVFRYSLDSSFAQGEGEYGRIFNLAAPATDSEPFVRKAETEGIRVASLDEKAEKLAFNRRRKLAKMAKQQLAGEERWNRVLRNRATAGI